MPQVLPFIASGLGIYSAIKGGQSQSKAQGLTEEQLAQQDAIRKMVLGRLQGQHGAVGNPFSGSYGPIGPPPPAPPPPQRPGFGWPGGPVL